VDLGTGAWEADTAKVPAPRLTLCGNTGRAGLSNQGISGPKDEIVEAAELADAHEFIARMPEGYDSLIGDRGMTLSGGQRQRIGIARALIRDSPTLILDEPTAALDAESEELVIEALERLMKGRTVITIAHRLSTLRDADKIVVIKDGVVAEEGAYDELLMLDGVYAHLHHLQFEKRHTPLPPSSGAQPSKLRRG
jgi:ABC-type multidrug transport system fused ATPase/permease subunit